jgi:hypothetical protein
VHRRFDRHHRCIDRQERVEMYACGSEYPWIDLDGVRGHGSGHLTVMPSGRGCVYVCQMNFLEGGRVHDVPVTIAKHHRPHDRAQPPKITRSCIITLLSRSEISYSIQYMSHKMREPKKPFLSFSYSIKVVESLEVVEPFQLKVKNVKKHIS